MFNLMCLLMRGFSVGFLLFKKKTNMLKDELTILSGLVSHWFPSWTYQ